MKKQRTLNKELLSFTGVTSILTSQILPVSAQAVQTPLHTHFISTTPITHSHVNTTS